MATTTQGMPEKGKRKTTVPRMTFAGFIRSSALQLGILGVLIVLWGFFMIRAPETFLRPNIYASFMASVPFFGIVAMPLTMLVIAGEIDLSFPSIMALGVVSFLGVFEATGNVYLAFIACLGGGFLAGLLNGYLIVRIGMPALIATIGTQFFWRGVVLVARNGRSAVLVEPKDTLLGTALVGKIGNFIPMQMVWLVIIAGLTWVFLNRHRFGAHVYLIGDNVNSARLMGVKVDRTRMLLFAYVGMASAFAGLIASLHVSNFFTTLGEGHLLTTLASVFLGGTSVFGGTGTIIGTFIATFIIGSINAGIVAIGLTGFWTQLIYGLIVTVSVAMHTTIRHRLG